MQRCCYLTIGFLFLFVLSLMAETQHCVTLQNGTLYIGTVVFENADVVILKTEDGMRHQIPTHEILSRENYEVQEKPVQPLAEKKFGLAVELSAGVAIANHTVGASESAFLYLGACNALQRHIFWGGMIGFQTYQWNHTKYNYLPIAITATVPFTQQKNAPYMRASAGYGIALKRQAQGGLYADISIGWRHEMNEQIALFLGAHAAFQQAELLTTEVFDEASYNYSAINNLTTIGLVFVVQF